MKKFSLLLVRLTTALMASILCGATHAQSTLGLQQPTKAQLSQWGLETITVYSTPYKMGGFEPESKNYLISGPIDGPLKQCVALVRLIDAKKACDALQCKPLKPWGKHKAPLNQQHALLAQQCGKPHSKGTLLYDNTSGNQSDSDVIALSRQAYSDDTKKGGITAGPWLQAVVRDQFVIRLYTLNSEGVLSWAPKGGFSYRELEQ